MAPFRGEGFLHGGDQLVVERVAGVPGRDVTRERAAQEPEVAHQVEHLVPDELVLEAETVVEHRALPDDDGIVE